MNLRRRRQGLSTILPNGSQSSYRTFSGQVLMKQMWTRLGKPQNAATPGTSNHGWGLAVDANNPGGVNASGADFGYQKKWSDAAWEPWHFKWAGFGKILAEKFYEKTIKRGMNGKVVRRLKWYLTVLGYREPTKKKPDGWFTRKTVEQVKKFQRDHNLKADGVVGPQTWAVLRRAAAKRR